VQKQLSVAVSGSLASSVSLHVVFTGTGADVPPEATSPMLTAVLLIAVLLSVTVQLKRPVPPVFFATYCTVRASAAVLVPFPVPVTGAAAPCARLAIVLGLTATALLVPVGSPLAGHAASVKFVSVTVQFSRSAVPVFCTVIVTALLPSISRRAQSFITVSPGV